MVSKKRGASNRKIDGAPFALVSLGSQPGRSDGSDTVTGARDRLLLCYPLRSALRATRLSRTKADVAPGGLRLGAELCSLQSGASCPLRRASNAPNLTVPAEDANYGVASGTCNFKAAPRVCVGQTLNSGKSAGRVKAYLAGGCDGT